jgi:hypothetical protein
LAFTLGGRTARLVRKERPDSSPLKVREFVSHDSRHQFGSLNHARLGVRNADLQVRDGPDSGHIADIIRETRMTQSGRRAAIFCLADLNLRSGRGGVSTFRKAQKYNQATPN